MKKSIISIVAVLLATLAFSGCKEAAEIIGALPSEDILGYWSTTSEVTISVGEAILTVKDGSSIIVNNETVTVTMFFPDESFLQWGGDVAPSPSTSVTSQISNLWDSDSGTYVDGIDFITMSYIMSNSTTAVFVFDGDAFPAIKVPGPE